jgi:hypothetical protein
MIVLVKSHSDIYVDDYQFPPTTHLTASNINYNLETPKCM